MTMTRAEELIAELNGLVQGFNEAAQELIESIQHTDSSAPTMTIEELSEWLLALRSAKEAAESAKSCVNSAITSTNKAFCIAMTDTTKNPSGDVTFKSNLGTFSSSAEGYFSIHDAKIFYEWLQKKGGDYHAQFVTYATKKSALAELCNNLLADGFDVPPGIKDTIVPTVKVRRKNG